ncbi:arabinogalactan oligomer/maltooligosaccharide transport system permease protein [Arthrobacter pigmenti]|uniref:Maltose/maltodextrin transport system permease protein n=1 Tax=Arthrobacter pigmenti TaxID=271432 RepID=A0A846RSY2_9MICC|nr:ABC transporter permease subunit [Arthrobacter pigmenti]NJC23594.1 arabinogalactan oligomer/maltooligosaccharide transport system permease protein [Arthrobacter pigmenti]
MRTTEPPRTLPPKRSRTRYPTDSIGGLLAKIILLGIVDAFAVYVLIVLFMQEKWAVLLLAAAVTLLINWIYLRRGGLPAKYLAPGIFFLLVFQVFVMIFSGYVAFTNYGDGHNSTKEDAVNAIQLSAQQRVPDSPAYRISIVEQDGEFSFLTTNPDGDVSIGTTGDPLEEVSDAATDSTGKATELEGYRTLQFDEVLANQAEILEVTVPFSDDPDDGTLKTSDGSTAYVYSPTLVYDEAADTFTNTQTGIVYTDSGDGTFVSEDGEELGTGWKIDVGFANFVKAFTDENIRGPLVQVTLWTFTFALVSVLSTFALGLFLANAFNLPNLRGKRIYRILMILPYAFPAFLAGLVWSGLLNPEFGYVNNTFFGGADIPWLTDPLLAKVSVLVVNLWLGFPYMFLVCTGALQSLPEDVNEAARMDGASPWKLFTTIKLPLLLVSVAPLLIASFAFNFNNFNVIYMLTDGGPRLPETTANVGATDILITMVYEIAFGSGVGRDYGLASALSIIIFFIVAAISIISFRQTKALEEIH